MYTVGIMIVHSLVLAYLYGTYSFGTNYVAGNIADLQIYCYDRNPRKLRKQQATVILAAMAVVWIGMLGVVSYQVYSFPQTVTRIEEGEYARMPTDETVTMPTDGTELT